MYRIVDGVRSVQSRDGGVVLDISHGKLVRLNPIGSLIFDQLQQGRTEDQIVDRISREFDAPFPTVQSDVREFLKTLEEQQLLCDD